MEEDILEIFNIRDPFSSHRSSEVFIKGMVSFFILFIHLIKASNCTELAYVHNKTFGLQAQTVAVHVDLVISSKLTDQATAQKAKAKNVHVVLL